MTDSRDKGVDMPSLGQLLDTGIFFDVANIESLIDNAPFKFCFFDQDCRYIFANKTFCDAWKRTRSEVIGKFLTDIVDDEVAAKLQPHIDAVMTGKPQRFEAVIKDVNDEPLWIECTYSPYIDASGIVRGFFGITQDIQAYKLTDKSQAQLRFAVDQGVEGFALHDGQGDFLYVNPAQAQMYGYEPSELIGANWALLYGPEQANVIEHEYFPKLIAERRWQGELRGRRKNGEEFDVEVSLALITDAYGDPAGLVCNCRDVTDRKTADETVRQLQKMDAVGRVTGGVAHDFNNVLAVIVGNLELAHEASDARERERLLTHAIQAADRGARLTHRLLAFARKQPLSPTVTNPEIILNDIVPMLRVVLGEQIEVELVCDAGIWSIEVDRHQLENVIVNIATNARDAMRDGGKLTIEATNARVDDDYAAVAEIERGQYACITCSDTGTGMTKKVIEQAFEPFFTTKGMDAGTGLGLSMAHGFVKQSNGHIKIYSEPDEGTTVKIYLPRAHGVEDDNYSTQTLVVDPEASQKQILVVEDDAQFRETVSAQLASLDYRVLVARDGRDAMKVLNSEEQVDLLLTDVVLPGGVNGRQLADKARALRPGIAVIYMSGYSENAIIHQGRLDEGVTLIQKPFRRSDLIREVVKATEI